MAIPSTSKAYCRRRFRAKVVRSGLHGEAVHAHDGSFDAGVHELVHLLKHLVGHEVLARAVGLDDGLNQVLRHVAVVGEELLGVLGQAVAAVAEAGVIAAIELTMNPKLLSKSIRPKLLQSGQRERWRASQRFSTQPISLKDSAATNSHCFFS